MSGTSATAPLLPSRPAAGVSLAEAPAAWRVWTFLSVIYVVWGSTYLAIRVMVETVPPLLGAGFRFLLAGFLMLAFLAVRNGWSFVRPTRRELVGSLVMGLLLPGANAVVTIAEVDVPSGLAALLVAAIPLVVIVLRRFVVGEAVARRSIVGVAVGFVGVAILLLPGERPEGASLIGMLAIIGAAVMWGSGSVASPRLEQPRDQFAATGWNMLLGGFVISLFGVAIGEVPDFHPEQFSTNSVLAFAYLVVIGSLVAFSAYTWLLRNVPVSKVSTYAYVNPVIAIILGAVILGEEITSTVVIGAAIIVASVWTVVRTESRHRPA